MFQMFQNALTPMTARLSPPSVHPRPASEHPRCGGRRSGLLAVAAAVLMVVVGGASPARASTATEVYTPVAVSGTTVTFQGGGVVGNTFHATQNVTFNSLGFIDVNTNLSNFNFFNNPDGLLGSYEVAIWLTSTQTLLASTTVTPSSPLAESSQFRYAPIPATTILAGQDFTIGALLPANPLDGWLINAIAVDRTGITGPGLGRFLSGGTLSFPTQDPLAPWAIANASTAVVAPEPSTTASILLVLGGIAMFRRRRPAKANA